MSLMKALGLNKVSDAQKQVRRDDYTSGRRNKRGQLIAQPEPPPTTAADLLSASGPPVTASEAGSTAMVAALAARDKAKKRAKGGSLLGLPRSSSTAPVATAVTAPRTLVGGY